MSHPDKMSQREEVATKTTQKKYQGSTFMSMIILIFFLQKLWKSNAKPDYLKLHNILKFLVVSGVFCIVLINPSVLIHGKKIVETIVR